MIYTSYTFKKGSLYAKVDGELKDINVLVGNSGGSNKDITDHINDKNIHVTAAQKSAWDSKQNPISDLETIRVGAAKGATAIQSHQSLDAYATKGYVDDTYSNINAMTDTEVGEIIGE